VVLQCGNGAKDPGEEWDNNGAIGCTGCTIDVGYTWAGGDTTQIDTCFETCGDGRNLGQWACDDGNLVGGDGWDPWCMVEEFAVCAGGGPGTPGKLRY